MNKQLKLALLRDKIQWKLRYELNMLYLCIKYGIIEKRDFKMAEDNLLGMMIEILEEEVK